MNAFHFDRNALRFGQISLISVLVLGYIFNFPYAIYVGAIILLSALFMPAFAPRITLISFVCAQQLDPNRNP
jgi:hypothetical protein